MKHVKIVPALLFALLICFNCFSQTNKSQSQVEKQLIQVVDKWFTSAGKGDLDSFGNLMTEDFQLLAFGKRHNKGETLAMANGMSDIKYKLSNMRSGSGGDIAYLTFNVDVDFKYQGKRDTGRALETYLFKRENKEWKVHTKMLVMIEGENK